MESAQDPRDAGDETASDKFVGHAFTGLPSGIVGATLEIRMKPLGGVSSNDSIVLGLNPGNLWSWGRSLSSLPGNGTWQTTPARTFIFDLGSLPNVVGPPSTIVAQMNALHLLDVRRAG